MHSFETLKIQQSTICPPLIWINFYLDLEISSIIILSVSYSVILQVDQIWLQRLSRLALFEYADFDKEVLPFIRFHVKRIIPNVSKQALSREHIEKV